MVINCSLSQSDNTIEIFIPYFSLFSIWMCSCYEKVAGLQYYVKLSDLWGHGDCYTFMNGPTLVMQQICHPLPADHLPEFDAAGKQELTG